jgi:hypothetical protein
MADVKVTLKPSEELIAQATSEVSIVDTKGRTIKIKKPGVLAQYRLVEILGDSASNQIYMNMVLPLIYVTQIDDDVLPALGSKREVESLIQRLDEDGISSVIQAVQDNFGTRNPEADKQALKN